MQRISKILLPLDLEEVSLPSGTVYQAAGLARHFHAEIVLLYVIKPFTFVGSGDATHQLLEQAIAREEEKLKHCPGTHLDSLAVTRKVLKGDPANEIVRTARDEKIDLIVMPTHGYGALERFLLGSVTLKVIHNAGCPVWTGAHAKEVPDQQFSIRKVLCAVDFSPQSAKTARRAQDLATDFGASLILAHVTPGVEIYGPGGRHVLTEMKEELVSSAGRKLEKLQQELGAKAAVFIASGNVPSVMSQAAKETHADVVVVGARSLGGRVGSTAYGIIRESPVPVLTV